MKGMRIIFVVAVLLISEIIFSQQKVSVELKGGLFSVYSDNLKTYITDGFSGGETGPTELRFYPGISTKLFFENKFYLSYNLDYLDIFNRFSFSFSYDDYYDIRTQIYGDSFIRKQISNSLNAGYMFAGPFFIELGVSYYYNFSQKMNGIKRDWQYENQISDFNLQSLHYGGSDGLGLNAGLGFKFDFNFFYFTGNYRYMYDFGSSPGFKTKLKFAYHKHFINLGLGYFFS